MMILPRHFVTTAFGLIAAWMSLHAQLRADEQPMTWQPLNEPGIGGWVTSISVSPHDSTRVLVGGDVCGISYSADGGDTWRSAIGLPSWEVADITWHPKTPETVWAGTMSGPCISTDGGKTWELRRDGMPETAAHSYSSPIQTILFDPLNNRRLLALGGSRRDWFSTGNPLWGAVWESSDAGESWIMLSRIGPEGNVPLNESEGTNIIGGTFGCGIPEIVYIATQKDGFFESIDSGQSWTRRVDDFPHTNFTQLIPHPENPDIAWVTLGTHKTDEGELLSGGVYETTSGGMSWSPRNKGLDQAIRKQERNVSGYAALAVAPSNPKIMYTCDTSGKSGLIYRSKDGGENWTAVATKEIIGEETTETQKALYQVETFYPAALNAITTMTVDPSNPNVIFAGSKESLLRSQDGGETWHDIGASRTEDGSWKGSGLSGISANNIRFNPNRKGHFFLTGTGSAKALETTDGGVTWQLRGDMPFPWGSGNDVAFAGDSIFITTGQYTTSGSIIHSPNGKDYTTYHGQQYGLPEFKSKSMATGIYALEEDPDKAWAVVSGRLYQTVNGGKVWNRALTRTGFGWIAADTTMAGRFFVSGNPDCYVTVDGRTFQPIGGPRIAGQMTCDSNGTLYIAAPESVAASKNPMPGLWKYASKKWTRLLDDPYIVNVAVDPTNPQRIAVITNDAPHQDLCRSTGILLSSDGGKSWSESNAGLPMLRGTAVSFDPHNPTQLYCGTLGRGFFKMTWPNDQQIAGTRSYMSTAQDSNKAAPTKRSKQLTAQPPTTVAKQAVAGTSPEEDDTGGMDELPSPLRNGNMEAGSAKPAGWSNLWKGSGQVTAYRDTKIFKEGEASLAITTVGGRGKGAISQVMSAGIIRNINISAQFKLEGKATAQVAIQSFDASWKTLQYKTVRHARGTQDWMQVAKNATLPNGTVRFSVVLLIEGEGKAWLDDVVLKVTE